MPGPRRAPTGLGHRDPALGTWGGIDDAHTPPPDLGGCDPAVVPWATRGRRATKPSPALAATAGRP